MRSAHDPAPCSTLSRTAPKKVSTEHTFIFQLVAPFSRVSLLYISPACLGVSVPDIRPVVSGERRFCYNPPRTPTSWNVAMHDEQQKKEELLELLRAEIAALLCADDVSEEEKVFRMRLAQTIIEQGVA